MIDFKNLVSGEYYTFKLGGVWNTSFDVYYIGTTNINAIDSFNDKVNIRGEFFEPYNLGITTYLSFVSETTPILICKRVETRNPITVEDKPSLFLPITIIDSNDSQKLLKCSEVSININNITQYFKNSYEEVTYMNDLIDKIDKQLKDLPEMKSYLFELEYQLIDALYEESFIQDKNELIDFNKRKQENMKLSQKRKYEEQVNSYVMKSYEMDEKKNLYIQQATMLQSQMKQLQSKESELSIKEMKLNTIKNRMIYIIEDIRAGRYNPLNFPTFQELWDNAGV